MAPHSLPLIVTTYVLFYLAIFWGWYHFEPGSYLVPVMAAGLGAVMLSLVGGLCSTKTLGVYHGIHIEIRESHELIQSGPYLYLRNPYYLSNILEAIALTLIVNSRCDFPLLISSTETRAGNFGEQV